MRAVPTYMFRLERLDHKLGRNLDRGLTPAHRHLSDDITGSILTVSLRDPRAVNSQGSLSSLTSPTRGQGRTK